MEKADCLDWLDTISENKLFAVEAVEVVVEVVVVAVVVAVAAAPAAVVAVRAGAETDANVALKSTPEAVDKTFGITTLADRPYFPFLILPPAATPAAVTARGLFCTNTMRSEAESYLYSDAGF